MWNIERLNMLNVIIAIVVARTSLVSGQRGRQIIFKSYEDYSYDRGHDCITLNGCRGKCVDIRSCSVRFLALIGMPEHRKFLTQSQCGWNETFPKVCCDRYEKCPIPYNKFRSTSLPAEFYDQTNWVVASTQTPYTIGCVMSFVPQDPTLHCCGQEVTKDGKVRVIDLSPWAASIEYAGEDTIAVKCGGTLISGAYVLTAAHCLFVKAWTPVSVRLGDYDIDHPGIDCVEVNSGSEDCTDNPVTIPIERTILHPEYGYGSQLQGNDIALIRLKYNAPYTDFIRPVCLPRANLEENPSIGIKLTVVGWGALVETQSYSSTKHQIVLPFVRQGDCINAYRRFNISLGEGQICAGGEAGKDSCKGDSGGALMRVTENHTEIVGITSFGYTPCGTESMPSVYTNVHHYLPWIKSIVY